MRRLCIAALLVLALAAPARAARVYFLQGEQLGPVPRRAAGPGDALTSLLAGPTTRERAAGYRSAFPPGARVTRLAAGADGASVSVRVPGARAGSPAVSRALASQVSFTLRSLGFDDLSLALNGRTVATPAGVQPVMPPPEPPDLGPSVPAPADVLGLQSQLNVLRYLPRDAVTGVWDYRTEQAVVAFQSWTGLDRDAVVGPRTLAALTVGTIPFPAMSAEAQRIEVYRDRGVALLVRNGVVVRAVHVSTGGPGLPTPSGTFKVFRKERFSWSVPYRVWLPLASYFHRGIAFHAFPEVPTLPASHGCVRVSYPEAPTVYAFATLGTTVTVY